MKKELTNKFFDINKFPAEEGLIVFPISMNRISNPSQSAKTYYKYLNHFNPDKIVKSNPKAKAGGVFLYTDYLYLYSNEPAYKLRNRYSDLMVSHMKSFQSILKKDKHVVLDSFSYMSWSQVFLNSNFVGLFSELKKIYKKDKSLKKYLEEDIKKNKLKLNENQTNFILEEHLMAYLITKGQILLYNKFIDEHENWILLAYPGKPPKTLIYLYQQNFFKLDNPKNLYQNSWYDLEEKKVYDYKRIDLDTFKL